MQLAVYGAVLVIALGSVLLGLDWLSAPMSPMVDTEAGLRAPAPMRAAAPSAPSAPLPSPTVPGANIGAPIIAPGLTAPASPSAPAQAGAAAQAVPPAPLVAPAPITAPEPEVRCNVDACTAAYHSFRASDCTYQPTNGPRRLCAK